VATKFRLTAVVLSIVALGLLVPGSAVASSKGGKKTLKINATEKQFEFLDLGTPGPSLGDEFVLSERLFIRGRNVGESGVVCVVTQATPPYDVLTFHCVATLSLVKKGQITLQGLIEIQGENDQTPFRVAITGGTGKFRGAGGEATIREVSAGPPPKSVYKLRFDTGKKKKDRKDRKD
jgi:hypothetical protein